MARWIAGLMALGVLALAPATARASVYTDLVCAGAALEVCVNFDLSQVSGTQYQLVVTFQSSTGAIGQQGVMRAAAVYDPTNGFSFSGINVVSTSTGQTWSTGCSSLGNPGFAWACASANSPSSDMLPVGGSVTIKFTSSALISASDFTNGNLGFRGMVQSLGPLSCSLKPDSRAPGNVVGGTDQANADCTVTPEPISMALFGTGLAGMGGIGLLRRGRRRRTEGAGASV